MTDEIEPNELRRVFASLDDADATPPPYSDRLLADLQTTLNRERRTPAPADTVVVELDSAPSRRRSVSRRWLGVRIAATSAAAAVSFFVPGNLISWHCCHPLKSKNYGINLCSTTNGT